MTNVDPVRGYLDALRTYEAASDTAIKAVRFVNSAAHDMSSNTAGFLRGSLGIAAQMPEWARNKEAKHDMSAWPDTTKLQALFLAWHNAFNEVSAAWQLVPEADRPGLKSPPSHISAR
jgi:hypothetical protein